MKIILGSSSKPRKEVLESFGYEFEVMSPDIDEKAIRDDDLYKLPALLAEAKADAVVPRISEPSILITADQVVVCNGFLQEKPESPEEVKEYFERYKAHPAETVSAVAVTNTETGRRAVGVDIAKVYFDAVPDNVLEQYIESGVPYKHAGGFGHEHELIKPYVRKVEGTDDSVKGMPMELLNDLISQVS